MKNTLLILIALLISISGFSQNDKRLKGIEKELEKILTETKAAGFAVAVVEKNKIIYSKGFGYRDYEKKIPADGNTLFAIGSSSKAFTCAILGQLSNEDKIDFNESPLKYVPDLEFFNDELNNSVIIKDIMSHRTGIPRHDFAWYLFSTHSKDSLIMKIKYLEPFTGVRKQWYYNNFMFLLQGVIAEKITGKSWEDNISTRLFKPLEMNRSNASIDEMKESSNAAFGYELKDDKTIKKMKYYDIAAMAPAGSINSSVNEMANWLITWINNGKFKGTEILPETYVREAISSQAIVNPSFPDKETPNIHFTNYGYGWFLMSYKGHYRCEHGGNIDGFSASVSFFPTDSIGIVVLSNQNGSAVPSMVRNTLADRMLKADKTDWLKRFIKSRDEAKKMQEDMKENETKHIVKNTKPSHSLTNYTGEYSHPGYGEFSLVLKNDSLYAQFSSRKFYLKHLHYDIFQPYPVNGGSVDTTSGFGISFNFKTNNLGDIASSDVDIEPALGKPIEFKRTPSEVNVEKEQLDKYTGEFEISGTTIKVYTKGDDRLFLFVTGQPEYELAAIGEHLFKFKDVEGFKVEFVEAEDKTIKEILLIQPNGTFKATKK